MGLSSLALLLLWSSTVTAELDEHDYNHRGYKARKSLSDLRKRLAAQGGLKIDSVLDQYVRRPDPNYRYEILNTTVKPESPFWDTLIVKLYSQKWLTPDDWGRSVNRTDADDAVWWHYMSLFIPKKLDPKHMDTACIYITGDSNNASPPEKAQKEDNLIASAVAAELGIVTAALFQIPNAPLYFRDEKPVPQGRGEDRMIGWSWKHFMENPGNPYNLSKESEWLPRLPMTKAVLRAMDTITDLRSSTQKVEHFIIAGASKRGWTTWTTALVDPRVVAIAPIVWDCLHMTRTLPHMPRAYGGWTFAFKDYYELNITNQIDSPEFMLLSQAVDPYHYLADKSRFLMPKLVINAAGDEFLQNDNDRFWWEDMPVGQGKHRLMVQNAEHSEATGIFEIIPAIGAWARGLLETGGEWPGFEWEMDRDSGDITFRNLDPERRPSSVVMWHAPSWPKGGKRDWRLLVADKKIHPVIWFDKELNETSSGSNEWIAHHQKPFVNWIAFFIEVKYPGPPRYYDPSKNTEYRFTTQVSIVPDNKWAHRGCYGKECASLPLV